MLSTFGLPSPRKNWLFLSVRTTSLSTVNWTLRQKALCSSGVMESLWGRQSTVLRSAMELGYPGVQGPGVTAHSRKQASALLNSNLCC